MQDAALHLYAVDLLKVEIFIYLQGICEIIATGKAAVSDV